MFALVITIDTKAKTLPIEPQVISRGFIYMKDSEELTKSFIEETKAYLKEKMANAEQVNLGMLKAGLADVLAKSINEKTDRNPMVIPIFMDIA